jgi:hypothetical protein
MPLDFREKCARPCVRVCRNERLCRLLRRDCSRAVIAGGMGGPQGEHARSNISWRGLRFARSPPMAPVSYRKLQQLGSYRSSTPLSQQPRRPAGGVAFGSSRVSGSGKASRRISSQERSCRGASPAARPSASGFDGSGPGAGDGLLIGAWVTAGAGVHASNSAAENTSRAAARSA